MASNAIEALYILDHNNTPIVEHIYRGRPTSSKALLPLYLARPTPRPSLIYLTDVNPPTLLFSIIHARLLFLVPSSSEVEPLFVLEFLHRLCDVLEDFLGAPLLASKIQSSYDVVAQLLSEMCDAGSICSTESDALRDVVEVPGWMDKLLSGVGLQGSSPSLQQPGSLRPQFTLQSQSVGPAIPWRRANVKHTSNELYVDIVETLSVTLAPSGRPLAAYVNGSILFTAKISGVPDLLLTLSIPSGKHTIDRVIELPTFHPCVRLNRWKERPGELSFVPPDGKFLLAGYEVNLLPSADWTSPSTAKSLSLPASVEVVSSLGAAGLEFEVRVTISSSFASTASSHPRPTSGSGRLGSGRSTPSFFSAASSPAVPALQDVIITIPIPRSVRNVLELRPSRGEANFGTIEHEVEWRLSNKEAAVGGSATLRCSVVGPLDAEGIDAAAGVLDSVSGEYDESQQYQAESSATASVEKKRREETQRDSKQVDANAHLMPSSAAVSFSVKGWLASGIKVESLAIDIRKSKGLGEGVKPIKGAKYLTLSKKGIETRC